MDKCCGTCRYWIFEHSKSFTERLRERFKPIPDPYCRLNNKQRSKNEGYGCLGYKAADTGELYQRGIS